MNILKKYNKKMKFRAGFSLIELMVVLVIIGLLSGIVGITVIDKVKKARVTTARAQIGIFQEAVMNFKLDTGQYPDESMGLLALVEDPGLPGWNAEGYLQSTQIPLDPWGYEYLYSYPGSFGEFDIYSFGADGMEGGEDENADIYDSDVLAPESGNN
ncbi:MAG: type II secretion system major pseudopilin GspG [Sedimentisphaerales bacterium]|nr:type II secretion system major pseudopilin GspG [Sedimentisphaerales bacterium]